MTAPPRPPDDTRPSAEEMLDRVRRQAGAGARGRHRIYLGMAPGVGKTYAALMELHRRKARGTDVAIGFVETYGRPKTIEAIGDLEVIPRKRCEYKGVVVEEMDTDAILRRHPAVVLVDELAHTNVPGCSRHEKRWQDVLELLEHGITVISTVNIQHLESLADIVESITGVQVRERLPDWVVDEADEIELVDMSPHALRQRIRHGNVYPREQAERALQHFFREGNLMALRELALRKVATAVEQDLEEYMRRHAIDTVWPAAERVMVCVDAQPRSQHLIRRAWRRAQRQGSDLLAVFVETPAWAHATPEEKRRLEENLRFAEDLGAEVLRVPGADVAETLARVARERNVDSIVIGHSRHGRLHELLRGSTVHKLLRLARDVDVHIVADREPPTSQPGP
ncbi:MAG TPA: universal stress protein [Chloroflexota bacterium]|nr:universal stress protein [Chloroflexota bacterium]